MIALAFALAVQTAPAPEPSTSLQAITCVLMAAVQRASSGATADNIAGSALIDCRRELDAEQNAASSKAMRDGSSAQEANQIGQQSRAVLERILRNAAVERVMVVRSRS